MNKKTFSPEETFSFAEEFAGSLSAGDVICMYGDLGAGKTLFAQGIAKGLGVAENVNSPTFTIVNEYDGNLPFYHFDVYRIADPDEMYEIGFDEYLFGEGVCLIEWAELIEELLPYPRINITITRDPENPESARNIKIERLTNGGSHEGSRS